MASTIIVEDGTGVADANAYVDAAGARAYAALRGITLPAAPESGVDPVEPWLILASDYLESKCYIFTQATLTQGLSWPRKPRCWDSNPADYLMPTKVINAQCQLVIEQFNGISLLPTTPGGADGQFVVREKVDVIETTYSEKLGTLSTPTMPAVDALLREYVVYGGGSARIGTVRV